MVNGAIAGNRSVPRKNEKKLAVEQVRILFHGEKPGSRHPLHQLVLVDLELRVIGVGSLWLFLIRIDNHNSPGGLHVDCQVLQVNRPVFDVV